MLYRDDQAVLLVKVTGPEDKLQDFELSAHISLFTGAVHIKEDIDECMQDFLRTMVC